jgi:4-hydroxybenzoate polyprenyltransferase
MHNDGSSQVTLKGNAFIHREPPLCVDLDGTVVRTDLLFESIAAILRHRPYLLLRMPMWLMRGKAFLKMQLAARSRVNVALLPYNSKVIDWLQKEKLACRELVLATAANEVLAYAINSHLALFGQVIASSAESNVKGRTKLLAIRSKVGPEFDYVGDSPADEPIFRASRRAILITSAGQKQEWNSLTTVEKRRIQLGEKREFIFSLIKQLRLHQWVKNVLIFLPILSAHELGRTDLLVKATICFFAFSLTASSVYVLNDIVDIEADRSHPKKRYRPIASGAFPLVLGLVLVPLLLALGLSAAFFVSFECGVVTAFYFLLTSLYTFLVKKLVLYDVFTLAFLYTIRLFAGQAAYRIQLSTWLVSCCFFLFLSLAFCKRVSELAVPTESQAVGQNPELVSRRSYRVTDLTIILCFGVMSGLIASLITVLYVESDNVIRLYHHPRLLWLLCPLVLQWVARTWMLGYRGLIVEDPVLFSLKERGTWITAALGIILLIAASL